MRANRNPIGTSVPAQESVRLVLVGNKGQYTHVYDPQLVLPNGSGGMAPGAPLCGSGYRSPNGQTGNRNVPELFPSNAQFVTCVRCQKIARMNAKRYGQWVPPQGGRGE